MTNMDAPVPIPIESVFDSHFLINLLVIDYRASWWLKFKWMLVARVSALQNVDHEPSCVSVVLVNRRNTYF